MGFEQDIDELDIHIMKLIHEDSTISYNRLSVYCSVPITTIHNRFNRLKSLGLVNCDRTGRKKKVLVSIDELTDSVQEITNETTNGIRVYVKAVLNGLKGKEATETKDIVQTYLLLEILDVLERIERKLK